MTTLLGLILCSAVHAQFFPPAERDVWHDIFSSVKEISQREQGNNKDAKAELPWVRLVKEAEKIRKCPPSVEFQETPAPKDKGFLFQKRKNLIQQGVGYNAVLKGYDIIVPRQTDLTSIYESDVGSVETFFKQGTTWEKVHYFFENQSAKKYQECMVEIRFKPQASENTFIFLIDVPHMKIYLFLNEYTYKK